MIGEKSWAIEMNRSILVVLAVVVLLMFGAAWKMQANTQARADALAAQQAAQREAEAARARREREEKLVAAAQLEANRAAYADSLGKIFDINRRWVDAMNVAGGTPRMALAQPVINLQNIMYEMRDLKVEPCMVDGQVLMIGAMRMAVDGYTAFMRKEEPTAEFNFEQSDKMFKQGLDSVNKCQP